MRPGGFRLNRKICAAGPGERVHHGYVLYMWVIPGITQMNLFLRGKLMRDNLCIVFFMYVSYYRKNKVLIAHSAILPFHHFRHFRHFRHSAIPPFCHIKFRLAEDLMYPSNPTSPRSITFLSYININILLNI